MSITPTRIWLASKLINYGAIEMATGSVAQKNQ